MDEGAIAYSTLLEFSLSLRDSGEEHIKQQTSLCDRESDSALLCYCRRQLPESEEGMLRIHCLSLNLWLDFVASVFVKTGRDYFRRHLINDPHLNTFRCIQVAYHSSSLRVLGTARRFIRQTYLAPSLSLHTAGVGEVSVNPVYRNQGIATKILQNLLSTDLENDAVLCSLFASPPARLYVSLGFKKESRFIATMRESELPKLSKELTEEYEVKEAEYTIQEVESLLEIHRLYNAPYCGWLERNIEYWMDWIQAEDHRRLIAMKDNIAVGYLSAKSGTEEIEIIDFGCSNEESSEQIYVLLIQSWLKYHWQGRETVDEKEEYTISIPNPVTIDWSIEKQVKEDDHAFYRIDSKKKEDKERMDTLFSARTHLIWEIDSF